MNLPFDILEIIFQKVEYNDLLSLRAVSKYYKNITQDIQYNNVVIIGSRCLNKLNGLLNMFKLKRIYLSKIYSSTLLKSIVLSKGCKYYDYFTVAYTDDPYFTTGIQESPYRPFYIYHPKSYGMSNSSIIMIHERGTGMSVLTSQYFNLDKFYEKYYFKEDHNEQDDFKRKYLQIQEPMVKKIVKKLEITNKIGRYHDKSNFIITNAMKRGYKKYRKLKEKELNNQKVVIYYYDTKYERILPYDQIKKIMNYRSDTISFYRNKCWYIRLFKPRDITKEISLKDKNKKNFLNKKFKKIKKIKKFINKEAYPKSKYKKSWR